MTRRQAEKQALLLQQEKFLLREVEKLLKRSYQKGIPGDQIKRTLRLVAKHLR